MKTIELLALFFITLWLHYIATIAVTLETLTADYKKIQRVKQLSNEEKVIELFSKMMQVTTEP